jgi:hypothetical protein
MSEGRTWTSVSCCNHLCIVEGLDYISENLAKYMKTEMNAELQMDAAKKKAWLCSQTQENMVCEDVHATKYRRRNKSLINPTH